MEYYIDLPFYYKDLLIGKFRNYFQPWISTEFNISKINKSIYIGDIASAFNKDMLIDEGITHILSVVLGVEPMFPDEFEYLNLPTRDIINEDITEYLEECIEFIKDAITKNGKVLVHCAYGVSRSASVVIGYLIKEKHMSYEEAYNFVKEKRNIIEPNEGFKTQLLVYSWKQ